MLSNRIFVAGVMACVFLVASCGDAGKTSTSPTPPKVEPTAQDPVVKTVAVAARAPKVANAAPAALMTSLVPEGTVGLVYVPNLKGLGDGIERIAKATAPAKGGRGGAAFSLSQVVRSTGLELDDFDLARPAGFAMTLPKSAKSPPGMAAILPIKNEKRAAAKLKARNPKATVEVVDGFAVLVEKGTYRRGGLSAAMDGPLPEGDLVVRLDVASLWKTYGAQVTSAMADELGSMDGDARAEAVKPVMDAFTSVVQAATICDAVVRIDGTEVATDTTIHFAEGVDVPVFRLFSKSDLATLARAIPARGMISMAMAVDPEALWSSFEAVTSASLATSPAPARMVLEKALDSMRASLKTLGSGMAVTGGISDGGIEVVAIVEASDPAAYVASTVATTSALPEDGSPVTVMPPEERTVDGTKVTTLRVKLDPERMPGAGSPTRAAKSREAMEAMFGKDPFTYNFVALDEKVLLVMGSDELLARAIKASRSGADAPPTALSKALAAAGPDTVGYCAIDLGALVRETVALATRSMGTKTPRQAAPSSGDDATPLTVIVNAGQNRLRLRASVDVGKTAKLFMSMMPR
jgi:hypothetical protein